MIFKEDMKIFSPVIIHLFEATYPHGTTIKQMRQDASKHGWIRIVLERMKSENE